MEEKELAETNKIYGSIFKILRELQVDADGKLPSNMGSSDYQTASNISNEVKKLFVKNSVVIIPNEEIIGESHVIHKDRLNLLVRIKGSYTLVHVEDESSVTISGHGDGLAVGTAVASNIASTFALKNALLRTFLISEQSVENQAMQQAPEPRQTPAARKAEQAKKTTKTSKKGPRDVIREEFIEPGKRDRKDVNDLVELVKKDGLAGDDLYGEVLNRLRAGEVA